MTDVERAARDRAALYLHAATLAMDRGDRDEADALEQRAFDLQQAFFFSVPRSGEPTPELAAGPEEVRAMLEEARAFWDREEAETLRAIAEEKRRGGVGVLMMLRVRWGVAAAALERLDADIRKLDEEETYD